MLVGGLVGWLVGWLGWVGLGWVGLGWVGLGWLCENTSCIPGLDVIHADCHCMAQGETVHLLPLVE